MAKVIVIKKEKPSKKMVISKKENEIVKVFKKNDVDELENFRNMMLDNISKEIQKHNPDINVWKLNDPNVPTRLKRVIPTGLPGFDIISARTPMGRTGLPVGRQIELFGENASGKTSLACLWAGASQRAGWVVEWLEHENKLDTDRAQFLGLDGNKCNISQPNCLEDTIKIIDNIMDKTPERDNLPENLKMVGTFIVVDSVAAMPSRVELESSKKGKGNQRKGMESNYIGVFQKKMSQAQRRITNKLSKRNITILWLNQTRDKIGFGAFKGGKNTYGGNALKFYCAQRWKIWNQLIKGKGIQIHIINVKNQCGVVPYGECEVFLDFRKGFDYIDSWIEAMVNLAMATKVGNKITMNTGTKDGMVVTVKKMKNMYEENPAWFVEYEKLMKDHIGDYTFISRKQKKKNDEKDKDDGEDSEE